MGSNIDIRQTAYKRVMGEVSTYAYHTNANLTDIAYSNGLRLFAQLNGSGFITHLLWLDTNGTVLRHYRFRWHPSATNDKVYAVVDARGREVTNYWDNLGRLIGRLYPDGSTISNRYVKLDGPGFANGTGGTNLLDRTQATDRLGRSTSFAYDCMRQLSAVTDALGNTTACAWCACGGLDSVTDPMTNVTRFVYDYAGRVTDVYLPGTNQVVHVAWSATGEPTDLWDASGLVSLSYNHQGLRTGLATTAGSLEQVAYDAVGKLTNIAYSAGVSSNVTLTCDKSNRLVTMDDAAGHTAFAWTPWGALASEDGPWAADTVSYSHNASGLRSALSLIQPNATAWGQTYTYDSAWRLATLSSPAGEFGYNYLNASRLPTLLTLPNSARITNTYDTLGRLLSTALLAANDTTLNLHGYLYDAADRRTNHTLTAGNQWSYGYDAIGQLTSALGRESGGASRAHEQLGYAYDAAGNLTNRVNGSFWQRFWHGTNGLNQLSNVVRATNASYTVAGMVRGSATGVTVKQNAETTPTNATLYADGSFVRTNVALADGANTLTAVATDAFGRSATNVASSWLPGTTTFSYDLNGNLTGDGHRTFAYDDDAQLVSVTSTNGVNNWTQSTFTYDALGRRRVRTESVWRNNAWVAQSVTRYVYDDMLVLQERDGNNIPGATYTRGPDLSGGLQRAGGIGGLLALTRQLAVDPEHFYYHADAGGNVTALTDLRQAVVARYHYDPYGNLLGLSGPMAEANLYR